MSRYDISLYVDPSPSKDFKHFEVYRAPELPIIAVSTAAKTITIEGKFASWYEIGDDLEVTLSTGNDGNYTVASVSEATGNTVITMDEAIPSAVPDGLLKQKLLKQLAVRSSSTSFEDRGLPTGFYYYVVYAVDKNDNYSDPSNIIIKTAPEFIVPPAQPAGLTAIRADDLQSVEIFWQANTEEDLKGYVIYRSFDGLNYHVAAIVGSTANNYKDTKIPPLQDTDSSTTPVMYALVAISKAYIESAPAGPTFPIEVPIVTGLRGIVDYLSINVYWNYNKPEDGIVSYDIIYRPIGTPAWTLAGTAAHPRISFRIEGPLIKNSTYEVGIIVRPHTGAIDYVQPLPIPVTIPNYETDTTRPASPEFLEADLDPQFNRMFMSWRRVKVDDDFLQYQIWWAKLFDIIDVDTANKRFTIDGYQLLYFSPGEYIQVLGSSGNDYIYTIKTVSPAFPPARTIIEVEETITSAAIGGMLFQLILDGTTTQNNWTFRNMRQHFTKEPVSLTFPITGVNQGAKQFTFSKEAAYYFPTGGIFTILGSTGNNGTYTVSTSSQSSGSTTVTVVEVIPSAVVDGTIFLTTPTQRAFILSITAIDRSGNQSLPASTSYIYENWISTDIFGPGWIDVVRSISSGLFNDHDAALPLPITPFAQFYLQWNDSGRSAKHFRRYIIFESVDLIPSGDPTYHLPMPLFDFDDERQIRGHSSDNSFTVHNNDRVRGFVTAQRTIVASNPSTRTFSLSGDLRGFFRVGNKVRVYGSTGYDNDYTVQSVSFASPNTIVTVNESVPSGSGGNIYDLGLDKSKWYAVLSEDWFGDRYAALPFYPTLEIK